MIERTLSCIPGGPPQRPRAGGLGMFGADGPDTIEPVSFALNSFTSCPSTDFGLPGNCVSHIDLSIGT